MGVAGAAGLLARHGRPWASKIVLRDMSLVIDVTRAFYWFVKRRLLESGAPDSSARNMDRYGTSMVQLGQFYRDLFRRLRERRCHIALVHEGHALSESLHGPLAAKALHMERSANRALHALAEGRPFRSLCSLPELASNCLREVINELGLAPDQLHQAVHEVHPELVRLARERRCPVVSCHSDLILFDLPDGFIHMPELELPADSTSDWECNLYSHAAMLRTYNLAPGRHTGALRCLSTLLRDDFCARHTGAVNRLLELDESHLELRLDERRLKVVRLAHVLAHWPARLTTAQSVRCALVEYAQHELQQQRTAELVRDFDRVHESYTRCYDFLACDLIQTFAQANVRDLPDALLRRESTVNFLAHVRQREFRRTNIQDIETFRSTFSLGDRVKQYLAEAVGEPDARVYDREYARMLRRSLGGPTNQAPLLREPLTQAVLFTLFHFSERRRASLARKLNKSLQLDAEHAGRLALLLLLARYALKLTPRTTYDNTDQQQQQPLQAALAGSQSRSTSHSSSGRRARAPGGAPTRDHTDPEDKLAYRYHRREVKLKFFQAVLNSFVYHMDHQHQGDQSSRELPADLRVARDRCAALALGAPSVQARPRDQDYATCKHLVEALNSTLHAYKELNSLYNFPGPNLLVNRHYDAVLIYKLLVRASNNLAGYLLRLDDELERELCDF